MKKRENWLQAAVRAQQALTFDHVQRLQQARVELLEARQLASSTHQNLRSLGESWASLRRDASSSAALDDSYRLFHDFLYGKARTAGEAAVASQAWMDLAVGDLQQSHAAQQTLEKVVRQAAERRRQEAHDKEARAAVDAWLLGRLHGGLAQTDSQGGGSDDADSR